MRLKRSSFLLIITIIIFSNCLFSQSWSWPESAVYDAQNDRYLISNTGSGDIIIIPRNDPENLGILVIGTNSGYTSMRGICIIGNTIWGACTANDPPAYTQTLVGFDITTGNVTDEIIIPNGDFINDVSPGPGDIIYLSDNNNIYEVNILTGTFTTLLTSAYAFNGLLYEASNNRLIYTDDSPQGGSQISAMDINTHATSVLFINPVGVSALDGLTKDHLGNYYVSEWSSPHEIHRYDPNFQSIELAASGFNGVPFHGAADIFFHDMSGLGKQQNVMDSEEGVLVVPNNQSGGPNNLGYVDIIPFSLLDTDDEESIPTKISLHQNFPNPFNPNTSISYDIDKESAVKLTVYDLLGSEVVQLVNNVEQPGAKVVRWDGRNQRGELVNGGVYLYKLEIGNYIETKKMVLLK